MAIHYNVFSKRKKLIKTIETVSNNLAVVYKGISVHNIVIKIHDKCK